ncbi:MAG: hypothetical protein HOW97_09165 [Catenulispora sp.]|nr:hypothetical protein [Catenulispora sp.]
MTGRRGFFESEDAYVRRATGEAYRAAAGADARLLTLIRAAETRMDGLAARIEILAEALDTFIEASEVRREAEQFGAAAAVRALVRPHIFALMSAETPVPAMAGVVDVPEYWLPPAVLGLVRMLGGGDRGGDAGELLAEASRRDAYRTAVFLVCVLGARGAGAEAEPWLKAALPVMDKVDDASEVTLAARCLWLAYGAGRHGEAGRAVLGAWLEALAASVAPEDLERALGTLGGQPATWFTPVQSSRSRNLRSQAVESSLRASAAAADMLAVLLDALNGQPRAGVQAPAGSDPTPETLLTALIEEGSGPEAELLRRAAELEARSRRSALQDAAPPRRWDTSVGLAADLLLGDLFDFAEAAVERRTAALTALAPSLATLAETLLARTTDLPTTLSVPVPWQHPITLDHTTPFEQALAAVHADIDRVIAAEGSGGGRRQAEASYARAKERKQGATERLRDGADLLAAYRRQGEELHEAAKAAYAGVMDLLGRHAEGSA